MFAAQGLLLGVYLAIQVADANAGVGRAVADFELRDFRGLPHSLREHAGSKLVAVAFLGADCPLANRAAPRLMEMARTYGPRGVAFLGIDSNQQDSLAQLCQLARVHGIEFPLLKDPGNVVADRFGARRTPEVFVLDAARVVRYRGRVDDQYGIGYARPTAQRRDLALALDELLAGRPVSVPRTQAEGCFIGRVERRPAQGKVTYAGQVARILQQRCVSCHRAGATAPLPLTSYEEAAGWAETIAEVVSEGRMPPWDAEKFHYRPPPGTKAVYLAGTFNGWKPTGQRMDGPDAQGRFTTQLTLGPGAHEYKFVLEGKTWRPDPGNPDQVGYYGNSRRVVRQVATNGKVGPGVPR